MKVSCYLVLANGRKPRVVRATAKRPSLAANEAVIHLSLDIPVDVFEAPLFTVDVEKRQITVAVEVEDE